MVKVSEKGPINSTHLPHTSSKQFKKKKKKWQIEAKTYLLLTGKEEPASGGALNSFSLSKAALRKKELVQSILPRCTNLTSLLPLQLWSSGEEESEICDSQHTLHIRGKTHQ